MLNSVKESVGLTAHQQDLIVKLQDKLVEAEVRVRKRNMELDVAYLRVANLEKENRELKEKMVEERLEAKAAMTEQEYLNDHD